MSRPPVSIEKVLLVEDNPPAARATSRVLKSAGFDVTLAVSLAQAEADTSQYDVGVFDIDLGDGDGVELARRLLSNGKVRRAVFHSASGDANTHRRASSLGAYVAKSGDASDLVEAVERALADLRA